MCMRVGFNVIQHEFVSALNGNRSKVFRICVLYHDLDNACLNIDVGAHQSFAFSHLAKEQKKRQLQEPRAKISKSIKADKSRCARVIALRTE